MFVFARSSRLTPVKTHMNPENHWFVKWELPVFSGRHSQGPRWLSGKFCISISKSKHVSFSLSLSLHTHIYHTSYQINIHCEKKGEIDHQDLDLWVRPNSMSQLSSCAPFLFCRVWVQCVFTQSVLMMRCFHSNLLKQLGKATPSNFD